MDALAVRGDEGRCSLRKASGSRQTDFDPEMSEWGNPPNVSWVSFTEYIGKGGERGKRTKGTKRTKRSKRK